jgi:cyclopropane fatty-acyl-phospholipid synthase-like methyltransferase
MTGGYDDGYKACPCFWGANPGSLLLRLDAYGFNPRNAHVLDIGCGEGKNAVHLANQGSIVRALDISEEALKNATTFWNANKVHWECADARKVILPESTYDLVIAYGIMHCFSSQDEVATTINKIKSATKLSGFNILCAFNNRHQELHAHPGFHPLLLPHQFYLDLYKEWDIIYQSDEDLTETHPHNNIEHTHAMTRVIARRPR